jgi:hypothetical protein
VSRLEEHHRRRHDLVLGEHVALVLDAHQLADEQPVRRTPLVGDEPLRVVDVLGRARVGRDLQLLGVESSYILTIECDQSSSSAVSLRGTPSIEQITATE